MLAKQLKSLQMALKLLRDSCEECRKVIALEEQAICRHRIDELEQACALKEKIYEDLKNGVASCQQALKGLQVLEPGPVQPSSLNLGGACQLLDRLARQFSAQNPRDKKPLVMFATVKEQVEAVLTEFMAVKPLIEKNKFVIARLLYHHQQSYQFWSELIKEKSSNYNAQGAKQEQRRISQLAVRA